MMVSGLIESILVDYNIINVFIPDSDKSWKEYIQKRFCNITVVLVLFSSTKHCS